MLKKQDKLSIKRSVKNTGIMIGRLLLDVPLILIQKDKKEKNGAKFKNPMKKEKTGLIVKQHWILMKSGNQS